MEHNMMTVKEVAEYLRYTEQTIQKFVMRREIPFHKVRRGIRFRFSEIEQWVGKGGPRCPDCGKGDGEGGLFAGTENSGSDDETANETTGGNE